MLIYTYELGATRKKWNDQNRFKRGLNVYMEPVPYSISSISFIHGHDVMSHEPKWYTEKLAVIRQKLKMCADQHESFICHQSHSNDSSRWHL